MDTSKTTVGEEYLLLLQSIVPTLIGKAGELKFDKKNRIDLWLVLLYASILELANSACRLISASEPAGCRTLTRSTLEAFVDLRNLMLDNNYVNYLDVRSLDEWQKTFEAAKIGNVYFKSLCDEPGFDDEVAIEAKRLVSLRNDGYKILNAKDRFERADMSDEYQGIYDWLCSDTHNSLRGMSIRHIEYRDDNSFEICVLKNDPVDAQLPIMSALLDYLIESSKLIHIKFGKDQDAVKEFEEKLLATRNRVNPGYRGHT